MFTKSLMLGLVATALLTSSKVPTLANEIQSYQFYREPYPEGPSQPDTYPEDSSEIFKDSVEPRVLLG